MASLGLHRVENNGGWSALERYRLQGHSSRAFQGSILILIVLALVALQTSPVFADSGAVETPFNYFDVEMTAAPISLQLDRTPFLINPTAEPTLFSTIAGVNSNGSRAAQANLGTDGVGGRTTSVYPPPYLGAVLPGNLNQLPGMVPIPFLIPLPSFPDVPLPAASLLPALPIPPYLPSRAVARYPDQPEAYAGSPRQTGEDAEGLRVASALARARVEGVWANAVGGAIVVPTGGIRIGSVLANSNIDVKDKQVVGSAQAILFDVDIAGLIQIGMIKTNSVMATTSAGGKSDAATTTSVGEVTALGLPAVIDHAGIRIVGSPANVSISEANKMLADSLKAANISVRLGHTETGPDSDPNEAAGRQKTSGGGLLVETKQNLGQIPGVGGTAVVRIVLGLTAGFAESGRGSDGF